MNRQARRSDMRIFRHSDLLTHMVAADEALEDHPLLKNAMDSWQAGRVSRKLFCPACKASFVDDAAKVGAFLFAMPVNIDGLVATSAFCMSCVETLSATEVDAICTRVLRKLAPGGHFIDAGHR
jgi:hypothetical protein